MGVVVEFWGIRVSLQDQSGIKVRVGWEPDLEGDSDNSIAPSSKDSAAVKLLRLPSNGCVLVVFGCGSESPISLRAIFQ